MGGERSGRAVVALLAGLVLALLAVVLLRDVASVLWVWLGWWHWVVLPLAIGVVAAGLVALLRVAPATAERPVDPHETALAEAVAEEQERVEDLPLHQLVLEVSRSLRRDGWADARVDTGDPTSTLVVAHRATQSLVVRCKDLSSGRVTREEVEALVQRAVLSPHAAAVVVTSGGFSRGALVAAEELGVLPMDGEDTARWLALGTSAWPRLRHLSPRPATSR